MLNSIYKNKNGIALMVFSALCACGGQVLWKISVLVNPFELNGIILLIIGFVLYGIGALAMIFAYRFGEVSILQPMLSISSIFSTLIGYFFFHEYIGAKIVGIVIIMSGIIFIAGGESGI